MEYHLHLQILVNEFTSALRVIFKELFKEKYKIDWKESDQSCLNLFTELFSQLNESQKILLRKMNTDNWDFSLIRRVILKLIDNNSSIGQAIEEVRKIRNELDHSSSKAVSKIDYSKFHSTLIESLKFLKWHPERISEIHDIRHLEQRLSKIKLNENSLNKHKEDGNNFFKSKDFKSALVSYSKALEGEKISKEDKAIIYSNRSAANLELYLRNSNDLFIIDAYNDAKNYLVENPSYFKGYYRLGRVYHAKQKLEMAILFYKKCLVFYPANEEIKQFLAIANSSFEKESRMEHFTSLTMPVDYDEMIEKEIEKGRDRGINISKEKLQNLFLNDENRADVIKPINTDSVLKNVKRTK